MKVNKVNDKEGNRYLGIYFRKDNRRKTYKKKIKDIVDKACNIFTWKKLNDKQIITWNMVIIPRIEYQLQAIVLTKNECIQLMTRINCLVKNSAQISRSSPNFILYEKGLYGLKHDLQIEMLCKNIIYQANGNEKLSLLFESR